jgi:hypothetical protein
MDNSLAPVNLNALRSAAAEEPQHQDLMSMINAKRQMYTNMGVSERDMMPLLNFEFRRNPRIAAMLMGNSGSLMRDPMLGGVSGTSPTMLLGRLGIEGQNARAGVGGVAVQMPDGSIRHMPGVADVGYSAPVFGGNLDVSGEYGLMGSQNRPISARVRYTKDF